MRASTSVRKAVRLSLRMLLVIFILALLPAVGQSMIRAPLFSGLSKTVDAVAAINGSGFHNSGTPVAAGSTALYAVSGNEGQAGF